jgi:hypothetical protein
MKMKLTFKEKAKLFWERNKTGILGMLIAVGALTGAGCYMAHVNRKEAERQEEELAEQIQRQTAKEARKIEEDTDNIVTGIDELEKADDAALDEEDRIASNPDNQLTDGGYVAPDRNNLNEADCPNLLANCVPLTSMGQFGQDIIDRYKEEWPDWDAVGMFNPETAVADVYVDFCHEKWLEAQREKAWREKEAESQEKQAS